MDPFHFIIQMSLDFLSFSFSPFVQEFPDAEIVNREDDMGLPGLRQAKMSYAPMGFARKYRIKQLDYQAGSAE